MQQGYGQQYGQQGIARQPQVGGAPGFAGPVPGGAGGPLLASPIPVPGLVGPGFGIGGPAFGGMGSVDPLNRIYGGPFNGPFAAQNGGPWAGPFRSNSNNINPLGGRFRG